MSYVIEYDGKSLGKTGDIYATSYGKIAANTNELQQTATRVVVILHDRTDSDAADLDNLDNILPFGGAAGFQHRALKVTLGKHSFNFPGAAPEYRRVIQRPEGKAALIVFYVNASLGVDFADWNRSDPKQAAVPSGRPLIECSISFNKNQRTAVEIDTLRDNAGLAELLITKHLSDAPLFDAVLNGQQMPALTLTPPNLTLYGQPYNMNVMTHVALADGLFLRADAHRWRIASPDAEIQRLLDDVPAWLSGGTAWRGDQSGHPIETLLLRAPPAVLRQDNFGV